MNAAVAAGRPKSLIAFRRDRREAGFLFGSQASSALMRANKKRSMASSGRPLYLMTLSGGQK